MTAEIHSVGLFGMTAYTVEVETDLSVGLPRFDVVGLPDAAVRESRDRVCAVMKNCGYEFPTGKITVNLAPADLKKSGPVYDLAVFLSLLAASGQLALPEEEPAHLGKAVVIGELSLSGQVRPVCGVLPMVLHAREQGFSAAFVPADNGPEAGVVDGIAVYPVAHVRDLLRFLTGGGGLSPAAPVPPSLETEAFAPDFSEVRGQASARRALEIAAAGGHNLLMIGSPGAGKSMLAKRLPSILPPMTFDEAMETTMIYSIAGMLPRGQSLLTARPFRAPHHTISPAGLSGGGSIPRPGEISLAHNGVLFLDELPEFSRAAMEILRQPVEDGQVTISRVNGTLSYPCSVMLAAAMNPCPCGYFGHPTRPCTCSPLKVSQYLGKVSGPLLDRLDLHVEVPPVEFESLSSREPAESSAAIRERVSRARAMQTDRYRKLGISCNARLTPAQLSGACPVTDGGMALLKQAFDRLGLSGRAYDRILKVGRTIADLEGSEMIQTRHIAEAVQYRSLDRKYWQR